MPPFEREDDDDDSTRAMLMAGFEAFDEGKLTAENAIEFELPKREPTESKTDGSASGAGQGGQSAQQTGDAVKPPAADGKQTSERQRDESGRFASGEAKPAGDKPADQAKPADQQKPQQSQDTPPAAAPAAAPEPAPAELSRQANAVWAEATPALREYIAETEDALAKLYTPMQDVFSAAKEVGVPWNQFVGNLVKAERHLRTNPEDALIWLAERSKIDLDELADYALAKRNGNGGVPAQQYANNPDLARAVQPLAEQVAQLSSRLTQRDQAEAQQRQQQADARNNAIKAEIQQFTSAPERAHFKDVETEFWAQIPAIKAVKPNASIKEILQDAYDRATWANPTVRAKLQAEQQQRQAEAQRAKRSRGLESLTGHRGSPSPASPAANGAAVSLRDEIAANWAAIDAR